MDIGMLVKGSDRPQPDRSRTLINNEEGPLKENNEMHGHGTLNHWTG